MELVRQALRAGAGVNQANEEGLTALHSAACNGHAAIVSLLLSCGADVNAVRQTAPIARMCVGLTLTVLAHSWTRTGGRLCTAPRALERWRWCVRSSSMAPTCLRPTPTTTSPWTLPSTSTPSSTLPVPSARRGGHTHACRAL
jgi:hypothetical protein